MTETVASLQKIKEKLRGGERDISKKGNLELLCPSN